MGKTASTLKARSPQSHSLQRKVNTIVSIRVSSAQSQRSLTLRSGVGGAKVQPFEIIAGEESIIKNWARNNVADWKPHMAQRNLLYAFQGSPELFHQTFLRVESCAGPITSKPPPYPLLWDSQASRQREPFNFRLPWNSAQKVATTRCFKVVVTWP